MKLNPKQQEAASILSGPVLVLAGAGAGKTKTLTERIIRLIESGVMPQHILAITFTNKAAMEMKDRVHTAIKNNPKLQFPVFEEGFVPFVSTFHALGVTILREQYKVLGVSKYFSIYDRQDSRRAIKEAVKKNDLDPKAWDTKKILSFISKNKGNGKRLADINMEEDSSYHRDTMIAIWRSYEAIKREDNAYDFDDLLLETAYLLRTNEQVREHYLRRWSHIHIDEYQDTNKVQYQIVRALTNKETNDIFAVGDPDQLIYGWRGAKISNIMRFEKDFPGTVSVILEQNYRSTKYIIDASNAVIEKNENRFPKKLFTENDQGDSVGVYAAYDAAEEATWITENIQNKINEGVDPGEIAVLYRANFQSRILEEACLKNDIPYQVLGTKFYDRAEVKDVLAYVQAALSPDSLIHVKRVINMPKRSLGKTSVLKIFAGKEDELTPRAKKSLEQFREILSNIKQFIDNGYPPSEVISHVIAVSGMEKMFRDSKKEEDLERIANMYELSEVASKYDTFPPEDGLMRFLEEVALASDQDSKDDSKPMVKLMTIHAAKGLEFDTVFVSGCEESLFTPQPGLDQKASDEKAEEERRLFYVAMTRAKNKLYLSWASVRMVYGSQEVNLISSFILDIPEECLSEENVGFSFTNNRLMGDDDEEAIIYLDF